jgi:hypothetical protein
VAMNPDPRIDKSNLMVHAVTHSFQHGESDGRAEEEPRCLGRILL